MFGTKWSKLLVVWVLCFCVKTAIAKPWPAVELKGRDEPTSASSTSSAVAETSASRADTPSQTPDAQGTTFTSSSTASKISSSAESSSGAVSASSTSVPVSVATGNIIGAAPSSSRANNDSTFNSTLTPDKLPLTPLVTPGFGVAGAILLVTGLVYTLLGIKQNRFQIYMSAAYLASLATTVLIVYVMNPPVSNAVQGAYVAAVAITGLVIGAAAIFFKELTEGLGCLLGGYSFSMWLLTLKRGGLIQSTGGKAVFIAAFTVVGFGTSFSHHTRPYGLIILISFGGATAIVLGIDCFSRAGLKEFWAWVWDVNDNLFPLGATTYPLTKGMKVESAAIIVLFLAGVVSQLKLWKIIKERREQRAKQRLEDERNTREEEENVGRRIEHHAAQERNQWEAIYGDKDTVTTGVESIRDSGFGDGESQKRTPTSATPSLRRLDEDHIEMAELSPTSPAEPLGAGLSFPKGSQDGSRSEQLKEDGAELTPIGGHETPAETLKRLSHASKQSSTPRIQQEEAVWVASGDGEARPERRLSHRESLRKSVQSSLRDSRRISIGSKTRQEEPQSPIVPEIEVEDNRSIAATVADEEPTPKIDSRRLSASSANLLRSASNKSRRSSKRFSKVEGMDGVWDDRASSVAATVDDDSDDDMRSKRSSLRSVPSIKKRTSRPGSVATVATDILGSDEPCTSEKEVVEPLDAEAMPKIDASDENAPDVNILSDNAQELEKPESTKVDQAKYAPVTSDRLPAQLPKIALTFRTNEWAKHISAADSPPEELTVPTSPTSPSAIDTEEPAPVNVLALQETTPVPQARRSASALSMNPARSAAPQGRSPSPHIQAPLSRSESQQSLHRLSTENLLTGRARGFRTSSTPEIPQVIAENPETDAHINTEKQRLSSAPFTTVAARNTLLGQRDSMLRSRASSYGIISNTSYATIPLASMPERHSNGSQVHLPALTHQPLEDEEWDNVSLRARQSQLRQSSSPYPYSSPLTTSNSPTPNNANDRPLYHPPSATPTPYSLPQQTRRQSTDKALQTHTQREARLSHFRQSVAKDLQAGRGGEAEIEQSRERLWENRKRDVERRHFEERAKNEKEREREVSMRLSSSGGLGAWGGGYGSGGSGGGSGSGSGGGVDMMERHREAMRRLQARAG